MDKLILVNKKEGVTSRDVCNKISKILNEKKVGHFGTLDPLATGLLVIGLGSFTKIGSLLSDTTKEYEVEVLIGTSTDTYDITGNILEEKKENISLEKLKEVLNSFVGTYNQEVPIYSSVHVNGKRLYEYARENKEVSLPKKEVTIFSVSNISLYTKNNNNYFSFKTLVSSGTYIRSLINDISKKVNIPMCMNALNRTKCLGFNIKDSYTISSIEKGSYKLLDIENVLDVLIKQVPKDLETNILNGNKIDLISDKYILFKKDNKNIALYGKYKNSMKPYLIFKN